MNNTILRNIIAIPLGIVASILLPKWFEYLFNVFIPFDFLETILNDYIVKILEGWILIAITTLIVPNKKMLFGIIQLILRIAVTIYWYVLSKELNLLPFIGCILALYFINKAIKEERKKLADEIRLLKQNEELKSKFSELK